MTKTDSNQRLEDTDAPMPSPHGRHVSAGETSRAVLFTDIDGTLIDHDTYDPGPAAEAVRRVRDAGIPIVFCSARTRAEQKHLRCRLGVTDPFIVENGGAIFVPRGYFDPRSVREPAASDPAPESEILDEIRLGLPYDDVRTRLHESARAAGLRVRGYGDMSVQEVSEITGLDLPSAARAKARGFDESFLIEGDDGHDDGDGTRAARLRRELGRRGMKLGRGTRLWAAMGPHDKGAAVRRLTGRFRDSFGTVTTYGIGDYLNDVEMLAAVDVPMLVQRPGGQWADISLPHLERIEAPGPRGWCEAAARVLARSTTAEAGLPRGA